MYSIKNLWNSLLYSMEKKKRLYVNVGCSHGLHNASVLRRCKIPAEAPAWLPWYISTLQQSNATTFNNQCRNTMIYVHEELHPDTVYKAPTSWKQLTSTLC